MFLKVREISEHLRVSERTVWSLIKDGRLSATRISRSTVRVREEEYNRFINDCTDQSGDRYPCPDHDVLASPGEEAVVNAA